VSTRETTSTSLVSAIKLTHVISKLPLLKLAGFVFALSTDIYRLHRLHLNQVKKASVMYDPHTRESRGFGFVTMETGEEADAAITALHSTDLMGKTMNVEKASIYPLLPKFSLIRERRLAEDALGHLPQAGITAPRKETTVRKVR
jgi:RNA recognition motif-containing protein